MSFSQTYQTRVSRLFLNGNVGESLLASTPGWQDADVLDMGRNEGGEIAAAWLSWVTCVAGDLDCCLDILIHVAQRLRDSEDVPSEELASAAKRVSDVLTKEVGRSHEGHLAFISPMCGIVHLYCTECPCCLLNSSVCPAD